MKVEINLTPLEHLFIQRVSSVFRVEPHGEGRIPLKASK